MWNNYLDVTPPDRKSPPSSVTSVYSDVVNSSSASDEGCLTDPSTGFLITPTVIVPSEDPPPIKLSVSSFPADLTKALPRFLSLKLAVFCR